MQEIPHEIALVSVGKNADDPVAAKDHTALVRWCLENNWRYVWNLLEFEYLNRLQQATDTLCTVYPYRYAFENSYKKLGPAFLRDPAFLNLVTLGGEPDPNIYYRTHLL